MPTWYQDQDGDGFGNPNVTTAACTRPDGYVAAGTDCCDTDRNAFPGQTRYFEIADACGSFDYDCDGLATPQSNGPMDCFAALHSCAFDANNKCSPTTSPPSDCNGAFTDYNTGACGQTWSIDVHICQVESGPCELFNTGGTGGTQACR